MRLALMCTLALCVFSAFPARAEDAAIYTWHSVTGSEADARFISVRYGMVNLETADGKKFQIGLNRLIPEDRALAERLAAAVSPEPPAQASRLKKAEPPLVKPAPVSAKLREQFGETLETAAGVAVPVEKLSGAEKIGVYFAAQWDESCRTFSAKLIETYKALKETGAKFEVVLVSSDLSSMAMRSHMSTLGMPWYSVPFEGERRRALGQVYNVSTFPRLVILSSSGTVLSKNAIDAVTQLGAKAYDTW